MQYFSLQELAALAGVSRRTLRHYDNIGLLKARRKNNNYRYYGEAELLHLQQILFYRTLGFSLDAIQELLNAPDFSLVKALESHRQALQKEHQKLASLLNTVDQTLHYLQGESQMNERQLFKGLSPEEEKQYAEEAQQRWDPELVQQSQKRWKSYSKARQEEILAEGEMIYQKVAKHIDKSPDHEEVQALVKQWHLHLQNFYTPTPQMLSGLGSMYVEDSRFRKNFDKVHPELAPFMQKAIGVYVSRL